MKVLLLSALLLTSAAAPSFAQGSYPKAKPKKISRATREMDAMPSVQRSYAPQAPEQQLPFCGTVQRPAHSGNWVVNTPGQTLGEGSVVQIERSGVVVGSGRIIQGGNGVAMMSPESANVVSGDTLRLEYAAEPVVLPVRTANLPTSQDPTYQEWLSRPSSFGSSFGSNFGYGGYGYDTGYGYGYNYGYGDYAYPAPCNTTPVPCNNTPPPCNNTPAPCNNSTPPPVHPFGGGGIPYRGR
jgi:hypothetical protein